MPRRRTLRRARACALLLAVATIVTGSIAAQGPPAVVPAPEAFFGFRMGAEGRLADWPEIEQYFARVAAASDRVEIAELGPTTEGRHMLAAIVSAPANIARLDAIRDANRRLADPRAIGEAEAKRLAAEQPVVVAIGASIHASEATATQTANEILHELATSNDPIVWDVLRSVVVILIPSLNPDGHARAADWVRRTRGTPFEGSRMPALGHRYAGHDVNRDAFMLTLAESRAVAGFFYSRWHPQVFLSMHEMSPHGPRMFVPPLADPVQPNSDPLLWREAALLGGAMALELERNGRAGVISNALFDYYSPGYEDSAPLGHNTVCLLSEVAGARLAWPLTVAARDLIGGERPAYAPTVSFPNPWPGGTWRPRDVVDYERDAVRGLLQAATLYRRQLLEGFYEMGRRAVERGRSGAPFAFIVPPEQRDPNAAAALVDILVQGGVEVQQAQEPFRVADTTYGAGSYLIPMAQPHRAYAKTLLERQDYPRPAAKDVAARRPYDVAGWTLPWQMGVTVDRVEQRFEPPVLSNVDRARIPAGQLLGERRPDLYILDAPGTSGILALGRLLEARLEPAWIRSAIEFNGHRYEAGSLLVSAGGRARDVITRITREIGLRADGVKGKRPEPTTGALRWARTGLHSPTAATSDEGWTRLILERYRVPYRSLADADIRRGDLGATYDVIVLPDVLPRDLLDGPPRNSLPAEYLGGLGESGVAALKAFVQSGGTLVCLDSSGALAVAALGLPVEDTLRDLSPQDVNCPGSLLRLVVDGTSPLGFGLARETAGFFADGSAYRALPSGAAAGGVRAVATFADRNLLMSGLLDGEARLAGKAAVLDVPYGNGRVVLFGIRPQHRAQSLATFRLLFNALVLPGPAASRRRGPRP